MAKKEMTMEELKAVIAEIEAIEESMKSDVETMSGFAKRGEYILIGVYAEIVNDKKKKRFDLAYNAGIHEQLR